MKLLEVADSRKRLLQHGCLLASATLGATGGALLVMRSAPVPVGVAAVTLGIAFFALCVSIRQRWEVEYRGHRVRFENGALTAERLYPGDGLVARGGLGYRMELRAPIQVGEGVGDEIMVLSEAGLTRFHCRIYVEEKQPAVPGPSALGPAEAALPKLPTATVPTPPTVSVAVLGSFLVAKHVLEFLAALIAVAGAAIACAAWWR